MKEYVINAKVVRTDDNLPFAKTVLPTTVTTKVGDSLLSPINSNNSIYTTPTTALSSFKRLGCFDYISSDPSHSTVTATSCSAAQGGCGNHFCFCFEHEFRGIFLYSTLEYFEEVGYIMVIDLGIKKKYYTCTKHSKVRRDLSFGDWRNIFIFLNVCYRVFLGWL